MLVCPYCVGFGTLLGTPECSKSSSGVITATTVLRTGFLFNLTKTGLSDNVGGVKYF
jgi:hypothetical protein